MTTSSFPTKTHTTSRNLTYSYIHIAAQSNKPYILFLHGFPSGAHDWNHQVSHFTSKGYGVVVPNLLGFGETSKPLEFEKYKFKDMATDIKELLEHESIPNVIGVGHDWGSSMLSRLVNYFPALFTKVAFLDVGYTPPGMQFSFDVVKGINAQVKEHAGYEIFGYFLLMDEEDAAELLDKNPLSVMSVFYSNNPEVIKDNMGATGGFRKWLEGSNKAEFENWVTEKDISTFQEFFSPNNGGFGAAKNWYTAQLHGINADDEKDLPEEAAIVKQPTLMITTSNILSTTADFAGKMKAVVPNLTVKELDCGHWIMLEKKDETNRILEDFIEG